eukprot:1378076-Amphidinium_carterae.1
MVDYEQVQAQLRKGDPIQVGRLQEQSPGNANPPLLSYLTQGREESVGHQTPRDQSTITDVDSQVMSLQGK